MLIKSNSIKSKILAITIILLVISNLAIGILGYSISKQQLNEKGQVILQNAVESAIQIIDLAQKSVDEGSLTLEETQEMVKTYFLGPMQSDGTRPIESPLDLGPNGYIDVYDQEGFLIVHPTLEGENVWDMKDKF